MLSLPTEAALPPIRFHAPHIPPATYDAVASALSSKHLRSGGSYSRKAKALVSQHVGHDRVFLTNSCTSALEISALALDLGPEDEVIVPSFTFCATATAFARKGARIVLADIDPATMMVTPETLEARVTSRTRAVVVVHYGGAAAPMAAIKDLCDRHGVVILEDAAQAFGAKQDGRAVGTCGLFAAYSFHETKIISAGHGGALVLNSDNSHLRERVEELLARGTNFPAFARGEVNHYEWTSVSSSFEMPDLNAALLYSQLVHSREILLKSRAIWAYYEKSLRDLPIEILRPGKGTKANGYSFAFLASDRETTYRILQGAARMGLGMQSHYKPLHLSSFAGRILAGSCVGAENTWGRLVRLPVHMDLSTGDAARICEFLKAELG
ncbi:aminotransferase class V-fold PLP-dependent enzyme [Roseibium aggregatum]|uniref:UDP-4-amino-4-deoxy-L-arabinose--oxoglutarate aminotransferase n=1 Tax=Roseibium aggregatum TaxID=187304 RepID=A0A0M6Y0F6_9HYPH|nr:aminotransferase class V-fold PLP-dependent enzyme [Roseibium aggregatum]CTQ43586.1 UDP-4-amino-4-deoxy-L-arabinose--oxoglutarate aminotransferase [Roseibium aggregatum]